MNVKALTVACGLGAAFFYFIYVSFILMVPVDYQAGMVAGAWLPVFHSITPMGFLLGLVQAIAFGALVGLVVGTVHNFFQHRWVASH